MLKRKIDNGELATRGEIKLALVKHLLKNMKGHISKERVLKFLQGDERLFRYALRKKIITAQHLHSFYFSYKKNF